MLRDFVEHVAHTHLCNARFLVGRGCELFSETHHAKTAGRQTRTLEGGLVQRIADATQGNGWMYASEIAHKLDPTTYKVPHVIKHRDKQKIIQTKKVRGRCYHILKQYRLG